MCNPHTVHLPSVHCRLCLACARPRFLLTVLSADNQHELAVLARKFSNLHVYGCWWFCNNPSIIEATTRMRLEMLGTAFTCQPGPHAHSALPAPCT